MEELIVFSHNDLDCLGAMVAIEYRFPTVPKKYFHTNYANIKTIVDDILAYQKENGNHHILIPDVSFADGKDELTKIYETFEHVTHIDHHLYPEGFWDDYPNMKVVWDKTKCAAKLTHEYLGNAGKNESLDKLINIIDIYDLWQTDSPAFDFAQDLNEYFWASIDYGVIEPLVQKIVQAGYKLPDDFKEVSAKIKESYTNAIASYEERQLIQRASKITIAFIDDWFNQVLISEMNNGQHFVIGANSKGIIRIRVNPDAGYTVEQLDELRLKTTGTKTIGHMHAFTYKMKSSISFDNLVLEVQRITEIIGEL